MTFKKFFGMIAVAIAMTFSFNSYAQENGNHDANGKVVRGAYETNSFGDNWFIGVGAGVNSFFGKGQDPRLGLGTEVYVGKWFTPAVGARIGWTGITDAVYSNNTVSNYWYNTANADFLWNVSHALGGYKETRVWNIILYPEFSYIGVKPRGVEGSYNQEFGAGVGLINSFRVSNRVAIDLDIKGVATKNDIFGSTAGQVGVVPTATLGLKINLGKKTGFVRHSTVAAAEAAAMRAEYDKVLASKDKKIVDLENELTSLKGQKPATVTDTVTITNNVMDPRPLIATFAIGSTELTPAIEAQIRNYVKDVDSNTVFDVVGSADSSTGSSERNEYLAKTRAAVVKSVLMSVGVNENNINTSTNIDATNNVVLSRSAVITKR